jgi:hypothetical protein
MVGSDAGPPPMPRREELRAAIDRSYTAALKAAEVYGTVSVRYTVGADGRARVVDAQSTNPALLPVGRAVAEGVRFTGGTTTEGRLSLVFHRPLRPEERLPRPRGPKR